MYLRTFIHASCLFIFACRIIWCYHINSYRIDLKIACGSFCAYHSGKMENNNAPATTARQCLTQCNILSTCQFWDFGNGFCRLRSEQGSNGREPDGKSSCGQKDCLLNGIFVSRICWLWSLFLYCRVLETVICIISHFNSNYMWRNYDKWHHNIWKLFRVWPRAFNLQRRLPLGIFWRRMHWK